MDTLIIIAVIAIVVVFAVRSSLKHFRGEGGCCGGGSTYKAKPKKLGSVAAQKTFMVEGMSCQHCVNRVMEAVQKNQHLSAQVDLKKGLVKVAMEQPVEDQVIIAAIEKAGYKVTSTK